MPNTKILARTSLGYTIPDQERPGYSVQRTIDDYLQDPTERHDDHNQR
jgi:hypothetical protein